MLRLSDLGALLARPDSTKPFTIHSDARSHVVGAVLIQESEDGEHLICYWSHKLSSADKNYSMTKRERLILSMAIKDIRHILGYRVIGL